jgi:hypothetical protein
MLTHEGDILATQSGSDGGKKRKAESSPDTTVSTLSAEDNFHKTVFESLRMPKELIDMQVLWCIQTSWRGQCRPIGTKLFKKQVAQYIALKISHQMKVVLRNDESIKNRKKFDPFL